jgi:CRP-like cAMP-binding protein
MNRQFIFARTAKGELAMRTVNGMQPDEKRVMLLIDGVSNIDMLGRKFPPSLQRQLDGIVTSLLKAGYIEEFVAGSKQFEGKLNKQLIFVRTAKGEVAMRTPGRIASDEKRVMLLIDGMTSIETLSKKLPPSLLGQLDEIILSLFKATYIEEQSSWRTVPHFERQTKSRLDYRIEKAEFQDAIDSNEQISANLLALAENEISQRIDLEQKLQQTQKNLIVAERQLAETHLQYGQIEHQLISRIEELEAQLAEKNASQKSPPTPLQTVKKTETAVPPIPVAVISKAPNPAQNPITPVETKQVAALPLGQKEMSASEASAYFAGIRPLNFFKGFSDAELNQLLTICEFKRVSAETTLITENKPNQIFYVLVSGKVRRVKNNHTVDFLQVGDCFGEVAYLKGATLLPFESVIARTECVLLTLNPTAFNGAPPTLRLRIAQRFMRIQSQRMNETLSSLLA